jgi:hypothetical protein
VKDTRNEWKIFVATRGRSSRWDYSMEINFEEIGYECGGVIPLAQNRNK